ncbi:MAG TPA: 30S ribosomal protein S8 [bacterium]|jgi:small subunit ribosomal protein S8|nr:30S ribosomal protein S8 [bacterium]HOR57240.1 30S ribosomal protein S8 [bacterium]HPL55907.1 30S ribosomal protein S8 [bacterium]HPM27578.1 30S ribosomal protein S8 [bacterium]
MVTDPIANMLTAIKNAKAVGRREVVLQHSKNKEAIARVLMSQGYLEDVSTTEKNNKKTLSLILGEKPIFRMRRISKPGNRIYRGVRLLPRPLRGRGLLIVSTSKGVITGAQASKEGIGGEIICEVY